MTLDIGIVNAYAVLGAKPLDKVVVVHDSENYDIAERFVKSSGARELKLKTKLLQLDRNRETFYPNLPSEVESDLTAFNPKIAINLLSVSICSVGCRVSLLRAEEKLKCKIGHVPGCSEDIFSRYMAGNFTEIRKTNEKVWRYLNKIKPRRMYVTTELGTELDIWVEGRKWLTDVVSLPGIPVNFPCGEVFIAPIENRVTGKLVCDISVEDIGRIQKPVTITIEDGICTHIEGERADEVREMLFTNTESRIVGEFGIGLNDEISHSEERTLLLEKANGTAHLAFGSNEDFGGMNFSSIHADFVFNQPSILADDTKIMEFGRLCI
ncbi:MAG: aminopeptidase [Syntrophobacteria bacterium]|jgi:leucyl aminopeptidase (aminopeptidase T)